MKLAENDLHPEWVRIDRMEQSGELARFLKEGIFETMLQLVLEPDELVAMVY